MAIEINEEVRASMTEAGIGPRYHDMSLLGVPEYGDRLMLKLQEHGNEIKAGRSLVWHGVGLTESMILFCRALHVNGVGCLIRPLVRMRPIINDPDFREHVTEVPVLCIMNAQDTRRGNPLHDNVMADLEYLIGKRIDNQRATFLQLAVPEDQAIGEMPNCYWSDEMLSHMERFFRIAKSDLVAPGRITV
jgi:hypothetical protein